MYRVQVSRRAERQIARLPATVRERILRRLRYLQDEPRPDGVVKMRGYEHRYRIRTGDYRVLYDIFDDELLVVVVEAGHRQHIY